MEANDQTKVKSLSLLKEDCHYSFVEYQGANLTHWSFDSGDDNINRINASFTCAHAFLIADGNVKSKGNREETYRKMLGDRLYILPTKEIENLIPLNVLKKVVEEEFKQ